MKAAGLNAVSVYTHMGLINPAPGVVDFDGFRALQPLFDAAKEAGIWIVLRPGKGRHCRMVKSNLIFQAHTSMRKRLPEGYLIGSPLRWLVAYERMPLTSGHPGKITSRASST